MKKKIILILALVIGAFLRLYSLGDVPNGLTWDEAAIGYNAYSLIKTGHDEHGAFLPLIFKSFGDFKPGAYIYLTIPSVAIFGLNEFAVRFPSALFGILSIYGVYLLVKELFKNELSASLAALALAISPWAVHFSHGAWEVNVFTTLLLFSIIYFLRFVEEKSDIWLFLIFSVASLYMYQAAKLLTPLVFIVLIIKTWPKFYRRFRTYLNPKKIMIMAPILVLGLYALLGSVFGEAGNRLVVLSIFNYKPTLSNTVFDNQKLLTFSLISSRYLYHFSPEVLFYEGARISERAHIPGLGLLNPLEFIFLVSGLYFLSKSNNKQSVWIVVGLLLISPIPGSLTLAEYSPVRSLFMIIPLAIISGLGMSVIVTNLKYYTLLVALPYLLITVYCFDLYYKHSQAVFATEFNFGYKQAMQVLKENPASKVIFTDVFGQPYIYYLFYTKYDPKTYQEKSHFTSGGLDVGKVGQVGNVEFHQFGNDELNREKDTLFIGSEGNINNQYDITGDNIELFKQIETPDKKIVFRIIKTKSK